MASLHLQDDTRELELSLTTVASNNSCLLMFEHRLHRSSLPINWVEFARNFKKLLRGNLVDAPGRRVEVYVPIVADDSEGGCAAFRIVAYGHASLQASVKEETQQIRG